MSEESVAETLSGRKKHKIAVFAEGERDTNDEDFFGSYDEAKAFCAGIRHGAGLYGCGGIAAFVLPEQNQLLKEYEDECREYEYDREPQGDQRR